MASGTGEKQPKDELGNVIEYELVNLTDPIIKLLTGGSDVATDCNTWHQKPTYCGHVNWSSHKIHREDRPDKKPLMIFDEGTVMGLCILTGKPCLHLAEYNYREAVQANLEQK